MIQTPLRAFLFMGQHMYAPLWTHLSILQFYWTTIWAVPKDTANYSTTELKLQRHSICIAESVLARFASVALKCATPGCGRSSSNCPSQNILSHVFTFAFDTFVTIQCLLSVMNPELNGHLLIHLGYIQCHILMLYAVELLNARKMNMCSLLLVHLA